MATLKTRSASAQCSQILSVLKKGHRITALFGVKRFGTTRLGARIWDLKAQGHNIEAEMVKTRSGKRVAEYFMPRRRAKAA